MARKWLPEWAKRRLRKHFPPRTSPIYHVARPRFWGSPARPRALVSYLTTPIRFEAPGDVVFSNHGIARSIVRALVAMGYTVDVIEWTDTSFVPAKKYDLFIGHGGMNFERIARLLDAHAVKVYFSTGCYWKFHNDQELFRVADLNRKRNANLRPDRYITASEEWATTHADGIITLGDAFGRATYAKFPQVVTVNNAAYRDDRYESVKKDFQQARRKFLFFAGNGSIHKGLDLLLDAFVDLDAELFVCQAIDPEFLGVYRRELTQHPRIHLIGPVGMRSPRYYEFVDQCAYVILPSCSEGSAGSVVECMHQGLIPVRSSAATIRADCGVVIEPCDVSGVKAAVRDLSARPASWCEEQSRRTREIAVSQFSEAAFLANLTRAVRTLVETRRASGGGHAGSP